MKNLLFFALAGILFYGCGLEQDVTVKLPSHESQLVVECYLEPGHRARLLLTESSGYFDAPTLPFVNDAKVAITYKSKTDSFKLNTSAVQSDYKYFNYVSNFTVPPDYQNEFRIDILDKKGRKITGKTFLVRPPRIDSVRIDFNRSSMANLVVFFNQDLKEKEYYRVIFHKDSLNNIVSNITFSDEFSDSEKIAIGTAYEYEEGDDGFVTLYKLDKAYYDFLQSVEAARNSNGNPFAQPSRIKSNVEGGLGIFTGLAYDFKSIPIERTD